MENNLLYPLFNSLSSCVRIIANRLNQLPTFVPYELDDKQYYFTNELAIPIGINRNGIQYLNIGNENSTTFICGTVGSGKSVMIKTILTTIIHNYPLIDLWLLDLKLVELGIFKNCKQAKVFEYDSDAIDMRLEQLLSITLDRYNTLFESGYTNINDYNKNSSNKILPILVVIEEVALLSKKGMKLLLKIASISRGCNVWIIYTCQRPSADILSPTLKAITNTRIVFRCENTKTSVIAMENELATELKGKGNGYLVNNYCTEFQGYFTDDTVVKEICNKHKRYEPKSKPTAKPNNTIKPKTNKIDTKPTDKMNIDNSENNSNWWDNI